MLFWILVILGLLIALFYLLTGQVSGLSESHGWERFGLVAGAAIMSLYAILLMFGSGERLGKSFQYLAVWGALGFALIAGYSFRDELSFFTQRVTGELMPPGHSVSVSSDNPREVAVRIRRRNDGHFTARGAVNGTTLTLLVDTGASTVVLTPADAKRAGIDISNLSYTVPVQTANGTTYSAPAVLRSVSVGAIVVENVEALIAKPGSLNENLLGMSFLRRLRSYSVSGDFLTLRS